MKSVIEPFRIKSVEPICMTTPAQREELLKQAGYNLFRIPASGIIVDLLTDSGTGAMSANQWAGLMTGDESYAGGYSFDHFEKAVRDITGFKHIIPTHQGRAAERILAGVMCDENSVVPNNTHFDTTRANIEAKGSAACDIPCAQSADPAKEFPFKGNIDLEALARIIKENAGNVPMGMITVTNNGGGGQPVSMENIKSASKLCHDNGIPFYIDACRFAENAWFIKNREPGYADKTPIEIAREMFSYADGCTMSAKKDGMVNIGGFICTNDDETARKMKDLLILTEGFPTYGGLAGRDLEAVAIGLYEALDENYLRYRTGQTQRLGELLTEAGVPILRPAGGHAIYLDAKTALPHVPVNQFPGHALAIEIYKHGGIRGCEIGSVMMGRFDPETGEEIPAVHELVRLAIPRRVYTQSHLDYTAEAIIEVFKKRDSIKGVRIVEQPKALRHFTAVFEPIA